MKAIGVLGTASNAGKSWVATALCAWLRREGIRVAPFKGQNMSNNAYATLEGGEIGVAQAVQAEACGLIPSVEMNPILLKPSGDSRSQLVRLGKGGEHVEAHRYYETIEASWEVVKATLDGWRERCDVLMMEGAGSPVELNLVDRDIANLKPIEYVGGKWILVGDIERGGVFAQIAGTWNLLDANARKNGLGYIVNRFRGDPALFAGAADYLKPYCPLPYLGLLPLNPKLKIEDEDSLCSSNSACVGLGGIAWVRLPHVSNSQDALPWSDDVGIEVYWTKQAKEIAQAGIIILPGSKNTLSDLEWLWESGLAEIIRERAQVGVPIVGICGGYQMLGQSVEDLTGSGGRVGWVQGLGLLSMQTVFNGEKTVGRRQAVCGADRWETYEIHLGETTWVGDKPEEESGLVSLADGRVDGVCWKKIWGTYQHGLFESPEMRRRLLSLAGVNGVQVHPRPWREQRLEIYEQMADALEAHLDLSGIRKYLEG